MARARFAAMMLCCFECLILALLVVSLASPAAAQSGSRNTPLPRPAASRRHEDIPSPQVGPQEMVVDVRIDGADDIPLDKLRSEVRTRAGRPLNSKMVEDDVRRLNATRMFLDVRPLYHRVPEGVIVVFQVVERPVLRYVKYVGNESIRDKHLIERTGLKEGDALDPYAVEEGRRKIKELYIERGFPEMSVDILEGNKKGDHGAVYVIHEGPRQRIRKVKFVGNTIATDGRLKTQIQSKPPKLWVFKGYVDRNKIGEDIDRLTAYYRSLGFFRARIGRELQYDKKDRWLTLTFYIDEGPRYKIRSISFLGNRKFDSEKLQANLKLKDGEYFDQAMMNQDVGEIRDRYGSQGYVFANVQADPRFLEEPGLLDLVYNVDEGARYRIGHINVHIEGENPHTRRTTVLNRLSFRPGDIVDIRKLRSSERRLKASNLFLHEPQRGITPKIVFSPPEEDDEETVAHKPDRRHRGFRGQSPDGPPQRAPVVHRDQRPNTWRPSGAPAADARQPLGPNAARSSSGAINPHPVPQRRQSVQLQPQGQTLASRWHPAGAVQPMANGHGNETIIVRGQYDPFGGGSSATPAVRPPGVSPRFPAPPPARVQPSPYGAYTAPNAPAPRPVYQSPPGTARQSSPSYSRAPANAAPAQSPYGPVYGGPPPSATGNNVAPAIPPADAPGPGTLPPPDLSGGNAQIYPDGGVNFLEPPPRDLDVDVLLQETQTGRLSFGVGVNSSAGLLGNIVIDEQNFDLFRFPHSFDEIRNGTAFRGAGQRLRIEAVPGSQIQRYLFSLTEPYLFDTPVSFGISGFFFDRRFREWDEQRLGGRLSLGRRLTPDLTATVAISAENVNIRNPSVPTPQDLTDVLGDNDVFIARFGLTHDTRDSTFLPTQGHMIQLAYEQGFGEFDFPRATIDARQYYLIRQRADRSGRHVLALRGRLGFTGNHTPIFERFFAGGFSTMRGFDFRGVSPREFGIPVGGQFQAIGSAEYLFPITADDMLRGVVFVDFGTVEESTKFVSQDFRASPGFGLRITVPALGPAPIALDFAVPVLHGEGDEIENFSFFVGLTR